MPSDWLEPEQEEAAPSPRAAEEPSPIAVAPDMVERAADRAPDEDNRPTSPKIETATEVAPDQASEFETAPPPAHENAATAPPPGREGIPSSIPTIAVASSAMTIPTSAEASSAEDDVHGAARRARRARFGAAAVALVGAATFWVALGGRSHSRVGSRETVKPLVTGAPVTATPAPPPAIAAEATPPKSPRVDEARPTAERPGAPSAPEPAFDEDDGKSSKKILPSLASSKAPAAAPAPAPRPERPADTELSDPGAASRAKGSLDDDALQQALAQGAERAKGCHVDGGPTGTARVTITLAPSGDVTGASVGGVFANSVEGACIAAKFRAVHVPPFTGADVVVRKSFSIE